MSVIIPTYFRNEKLGRTLQSVREQEHAPVGVIVVDDSGEGHASDTVAAFEDVILAFARTAYYAPTDRPQHVAELAASLFGRSGHELARRLRDAVIDRSDTLRRGE